MYILNTNIWKRGLVNLKHLRTKSINTLILQIVDPVSSLTVLPGDPSVNGLIAREAALGDTVGG